MKLKVIKQVYTIPNGLGESWAVLIDNKPKYVFTSKEQLEWFLRGLNGRS